MANGKRDTVAFATSSRGLRVNRTRNGGSHRSSKKHGLLSKVGSSGRDSNSNDSKVCGMTFATAKLGSKSQGGLDRNDARRVAAATLTLELPEPSNAKPRCRIQNILHFFQVALNHCAFYEDRAVWCTHRHLAQLW